MLWNIILILKGTGSGEDAVGERDSLRVGGSGRENCVERKIKIQNNLRIWIESQSSDLLAVWSVGLIYLTHLSVSPVELELFPVGELYLALTLSIDCPLNPGASMMWR